MIAAGSLDRRVTIQRNGAGEDEYGEQIEGWVDIGTRWTAVYYGTGSERREAAATQGSQAASFVMRADSLTRTITLQDRLVFDGAVWNITGRTLLGREGIDLSATRAA